MNVLGDNMIEMFLTMNKYSIELTKQKLDMYYTIRTLIPEIYENSHPLDPRMHGVSKRMGAVALLPTPTENNYRVLVAKLTENVDAYDVYTFFSYIVNFYEMKIQCDIALGDFYVVDYVNLKMGHIIKVTPTHVIKLTTILEKVFSNRVKGFHLINCPDFIDILISLVKKCLKPKLSSRIFVHKDLEELYEYVPRKILPKDYGGDELSLRELTDLWDKYMINNSERFNKLAKMKVKEKLRPRPLKNDEILGYHGNFKKLDVD